MTNKKFLHTFKAIKCLIWDSIHVCDQKKTFIDFLVFRKQWKVDNKRNKYERTTLSYIFCYITNKIVYCKNPHIRCNILKWNMLFFFIFPNNIFIFIINIYYWLIEISTQLCEKTCQTHTSKHWSFCWRQIWVLFY